MKLDKLPHEILVDILSCLNCIELESPALTFNRTLYNLCMPRLVGLLRRRKNIKRLQKLFPHKFEGGWNTCINAYRLDALRHCERLFDFLPRDPRKQPQWPNLDFLDMRGDFEWLQSLPEARNRQQFRSTAAQERFPGSNGDSRILFPEIEPATPERLQKLQKRAYQLGIAFPESFLRFCADRELQKRVPGNCRAFGLGRRFYPFRGLNHQGGYLVRFGHDNHVQYFLYLDQEGAEAVFEFYGENRNVPPSKRCIDPDWHWSDEHEYEGLGCDSEQLDAHYKQELTNCKASGHESCLAYRTVPTDHGVEDHSMSYCAISCNDVQCHETSPIDGSRLLYVVYSGFKGATFEEFVAMECIDSWSNRACFWLAGNDDAEEVPDLMWRAVVYFHTGEDTFIDGRGPKRPMDFEGPMKGQKFEWSWEDFDTDNGNYLDVLMIPKMADEGFIIAGRAE